MLCLSGFELYSRWVPLLDVTFAMFFFFFFSGNTLPFYRQRRANYSV